MTMEELEKLAKQYIENKTEADSYAELCTQGNKKIKEAMIEMGLDTITVDGVKITKSVSNRVDLNEEKVLAILLAEYGENMPAIKTRQYVDMDELEKLIYAGNITSETVAKLEAAKVVGPDIVTLRITKPKKGAKR